MTFNKPVPDDAVIRSMAELPISFPATTRSIVELAKKHDFDAEAIAFLEQFPNDKKFESGSDLTARCEELKILIEQKRDSPPERLNSPQY